MSETWLVAEAEDQAGRLDRFLALLIPDLSRTQIQRLIAAGLVRVNGRQARSGYAVQPGDRVEWRPVAPPQETPPPEAEAIPLEILYQDEHLLVVNKPRGLVVHPAPGHPAHTLVNALLALAPDAPGPQERPGIVHRLDADTTGLMVAALEQRCYRSLQRQIAARSVERRYRALVLGTPRFDTAHIDAPIGRDPGQRRRMAVLQAGEGRGAITDVAVMERFTGSSELQARLHTGRTHQIRVHLAYVGLPVLGDPVYGPSPRALRFLSRQAQEALEAIGGQALHAYHLAFDHPATGNRMEFEAPPPEDYCRLRAALAGEVRGSASSMA